MKFVMIMHPYVRSLNENEMWEPKLVQEGFKPETFDDLINRGIELIRRPDLDGFFHNQFGPVYQSLDFDEPGFFCGEMI